MHRGLARLVTIALALIAAMAGSASAASPPTVVTGAASSITTESATLNATVNPNGGVVTECKFEWGPTTPFLYTQSAPCSPSPGSGESPVAVSALATGLASNSEHHFRISATNAGGTSMGSDQRFTTPPLPPAVVTCKAEVTQTSARLCGTVEPNGGEVSECKFEYGETTAYGKTAACTPPPGTSPVEVHAEVTGLTPNTTYHFTISATNAGGTNKASDQSFKTLPRPPTVLTAAASSITHTAATLNATVNPEGRAVSECTFEYGPTTSYTSSAPCSPSPGSGESPVAVSASASGLTANTTYHFRISATSSEGTSHGSDQTFTTATPHAYKNGVILGGGKKLQVIGWGTLKLTNSTLGEVECHTASAGYLENPTGGGPAVAKVLGLVPYECVSASCKAAGGTGIEVIPRELPWSAEATEPATGVFRMRTGNKTKAAGAVSLGVDCIGVKNAEFLGETAPLALNNGVSIGSSPDEEEFDQPGSGELQNVTLGGLKIAGRLKILGYGEQELIEVKNP